QQRKYRLIRFFIFLPVFLAVLLEIDGFSSEILRFRLIFFRIPYTIKPIRCHAESPFSCPEEGAGLP
ncbi:MAG: hypothetical protein J6U63_03165, partial [Clostridia bacterium]|nr:hypothetical protein [Clostridia bacterium]